MNMHIQDIVSNDKRQYPRLYKNFNALIKTDYLGIKDVLCKNISQGGAFIEISLNKLEDPLLSYACLKYEKIYIKIILSEPMEAVDAIAIFKWGKEINSPPQKLDKKYKIGLEFIDILPEQKNLILNYTSDKSNNANSETKTLSNNITDRRAHIRINKNSSVKIEYMDPLTNSSSILIGQLVNLSEGGACISFDRPLPFVKYFNSRFNFNPICKDNFKAQIEVLWNSKDPHKIQYLYGGRFVGLDIESMRILQKALRFEQQFVRAQINPIMSMIETYIFSKIRDKVSNFINNDVRNYINNLIKIENEIEEGNADENKIQEIIYSTSEDIANKGKEIEELINQKTVSKEIRERFRHLVKCWVYKSPLIDRALKKPRGYAGDYKMIELVYDNLPTIGKSGIGYYYDKYFLTNSYAVAVRNRKDMMKQFLYDFIINYNSPKIRILNLACGSCREIKELFSTNFFSDKEINIVCVDHDIEALKFAENSLSLLSQNIQVEYLEENILNFLSKPNVYIEKLSRFDLVYSIGLADYFNDGLLKRFIKFSYDITIPNGKFIIAHKDIEKYKPVSPDWFCDWTFYPRNEEKLHDLIKSSKINNFYLKVEREESSKIFFFILTKGL